MKGRKDLPKTNVVKIDKDMHPAPKLEQEWVQASVKILRMYGIKVLRIQASTTQHGRHYYVWIDPPQDAQTANRLHYLLGDDAKRVDYNQARIDSGLVEWSKLFEPVGRKLRIIYPSRRKESHVTVLRRTGKDGKGGGI